jgi:hypothetical protein
MGVDPDLLLSDAALDAGVGALMARNAHHLQAMAPEERADALRHWRALAVDVLTAARATLAAAGDGPVGEPPAGEAAPPHAPGRAVIVLEDVGERDVAVHAAFHPELEELGDDEVAGTPAQLTALALLDELAGGDPDAAG